MHQYNALKMFKFNNTAAFVHDVFEKEDHAYVCQLACNMDSHHLEIQQKATLVAYKDKQVIERQEKTMQRIQQKNEEEARLAGINHITDVQEVTATLTAIKLKDQLQIF